MANCAILFYKTRLGLQLFIKSCRIIEIMALIRKSKLEHNDTLESKAI